MLLFFPFGDPPHAVEVADKRGERAARAGGGFEFVVGDVERYGRIVAPLGAGVHAVSAAVHRLYGVMCLQNSRGSQSAGSKLQPISTSMASALLSSCAASV